MSVKDLSGSFFESCFETDFDDVQRLYCADEVFAEICRDFVHLSTLAGTGTDLNPQLRESLAALEREIRSRLSTYQRNLESHGGSIPS